MGLFEVYVDALREREQYKRDFEGACVTIEDLTRRIIDLQRQLDRADEFNGELLVQIADLREEIVDKVTPKSNTVTVEVKVDTKDAMKELREFAAEVERIVKPIYVIGVDLA